MTKKIIPFRCSRCNVEFSPEEGGKCCKCNRVFCTNHLFRVKEGSKVILICEECDSAGRGKRKKNYILKLKEKLGKADK
jgi:hypothetical protein